MAWVESLEEVAGAAENGKTVETPSRDWSATIPNQDYSTSKTTLKTWTVRGGDVTLTVKYARATVKWSDGELEARSEDLGSETIKLSTTKAEETFEISAGWYYESELYKDLPSDDGSVSLEIKDPDGSAVTWTIQAGGTTVTHEVEKVEGSDGGYVQKPSFELKQGSAYYLKGEARCTEKTTKLADIKKLTLTGGGDSLDVINETSGEDSIVTKYIVAWVPSNAGELTTIESDFGSYTLTKTWTWHGSSVSWTWDVHHSSTSGGGGSGSGSGGGGGSSGGGSSGSGGSVADTASDEDEVLVSSNPSGTGIYVAGKGWHRPTSWSVRPSTLSQNFDWAGTRSIEVVGDARFSNASASDEWIEIDGSRISFAENTGSARSGSITVAVKINALPYWEKYDPETDTYSGATGEYTSESSSSAEIFCYQGAVSETLSEEDLEEAAEDAKAQKENEKFEAAFGSSSGGSVLPWLSVSPTYLALAGGETAEIQVYASSEPSAAFTSGGQDFVDGIDEFKVENEGRKSELDPYIFKVTAITKEDGVEAELAISTKDFDEPVLVAINSSSPWISADPSLLYSYETPEAWEWTTYLRASREFTLASTLPAWLSIEWKLHGSEDTWKAVEAGTVFPAVKSQAGGGWLIPAFRIVASANEEDTPRSAALDFKIPDDGVAGPRTATVTVLQAGGAIVENKLSREYYFIGSAEQTLTVEASAKLGWTWSLDGGASWCVPLDKEGTGENALFKMTFAIDSQEASAPRRSTNFRVFFRSPDSSAASEYVLTITQAAGSGENQSIAIVAGGSLEFNADGSESLTVEVETEGAEPLFKGDAFLAWQLRDVELVSVLNLGEKTVFSYEISLYPNEGLKRLSGDFTFYLEDEFGGGEASGAWTQGIYPPTEFRVFTGTLFENRSRAGFFGRKFST